MIQLSDQFASPPGPTGRPAVRRQRRRFVGAMRLVLPGVAIGLLVLVVAWPKIFGDVAGMIAPGAGFEGFSITEPMRMRHPRYVGTDSAGGRPYEVIAEEALVDPTAPDRITLSDMQAKVEGDDGTITRLAADNGLYQRGIGQLDLERNVKLRMADGMVFSTEQATVRLPARQASGQVPVHGEGPRGTIDADAFAIEQGGDVIRFAGNVRVVLVQGDPSRGEVP
ncbi:MAG TPA: LPS export ABC transporter periplasmic protein LptC [Geminicoccus sp.]|jgi:lipopolysaccharide export system protein LptC|uniref:LPS export ABC transporter periplasmic protein LptC n=1 Tax=Geminicoccus sp. TaxID=2024832 RepID=UPI002E345BDA|nr:LPS export ABC transporter periplasmic protein LptC [Geminicoccus sp.]HEX2524739.1 LPS export ABC transporter periplasmic protein LptC [Geminicoccus sp.]